MSKSFWTVSMTMGAALLAAGCIVQAQAATMDARTDPTSAGIVTQDQVALRAAPRDAAPVQTLLWRGEALELRGERGDYLQVWDHHRERGGYVRKAEVLAVGSAGAASADALMAVLGYVQQQPGQESLALGLAAATIQAAPASKLAGPAGADVLEAIGVQAERLAERANRNANKGGTPAADAREQATMSAHLDVAARHGVRFVSQEFDGRARLCYDGDAWRRLLAMKAARDEQRARASLALAGTGCSDPQATPSAREQADVARAKLLDAVPLTTLPAHWRNRVQTRRAAVWSHLAYAAARRGESSASAAAERAISAIASIDKSVLADDDSTRYTEAAVRVNAVRWAAMAKGQAAGALQVATRSLDDGQTCVSLFDRRKPTAAALAERCTWGVVWAASAAPNRENTALALAVQSTVAWRELWVFRKDASGWAINVMPPSAAMPGVGYAEFAGWVPGTRQLLVAREALAEGRSLRRFEVLKLDTLGTERQASDPALLAAFERWADVAWRRDSVALR